MDDESERDGPDDTAGAAEEIDPGDSIRLRRHVMPLGPRVLVRLLPGETRTSSGLYLPAGAKESHAEVVYAEVVEVARAQPDPDEDDDVGANVSGVPDGARILFKKKSGLPVPWDDRLLVVEVKDIVALVEEMGLEEVH